MTDEEIFNIADNISYTFRIRLYDQDVIAFAREIERLSTKQPEIVNQLSTVDSKTRCTTHHHACDCREEKFRNALEKARTALKQLMSRSMADPNRGYDYSGKWITVNAKVEDIQKVEEAIKTIEEVL